MLLMALRRGDSRVERRCKQTKLVPVCKQKNEIGPETVSFETFTKNLASACNRRMCAQGSAIISVIFLDVDGVLNCGSSMEGLREDCTGRLAQLVQDSHAHIVLSTTWRHTELGRTDILNALVKAG